MKHIEVSAAVMIQSNRVFAAQRKNSGELALRWEFPGGKLEAAESAEAAIVREIDEELNISIRVMQRLLVVEHQYQTFSITMHAFLCEIIEGTPRLNEHLDSRWLGKTELYDVAWADADLPIVKVVDALLV